MPFLHHDFPFQYDFHFLFYERYGLKQKATRKASMMKELIAAYASGNELTPYQASFKKAFDKVPGLIDKFAKTKHQVQNI
jgi:hypothetical protein